MPTHPQASASLSASARYASLFALIQSALTVDDGKALGVFPYHTAPHADRVPASKEQLAQALRAAIAALVDVLDIIDGDADDEPSLGWTTQHQDWPSRRLNDDDREADYAACTGSVDVGFDAGIPR